MALDNGYQACMMAPTEILANQHYETIKELLFGMDIRVELLTGSVKGKKREAILSGLLTGDVRILIGTHAVIEDTVNFSSSVLSLSTNSIVLGWHNVPAYGVRISSLPMCL